MNKEQFCVELKRAAVAFFHETPEADRTLEEWAAVHTAWIEGQAKSVVDGRRVTKADKDNREKLERAKAAGIVLKNVKVDLVEAYDVDMARKDALIAQLQRDLSTAQSDLAGAVEELRKGK
jgi:hypothetical protein